jgi:hypothetical protein
MWSYLSVRYNHAMNTLSIARPAPSIEIRTSASRKTLMKASEVNFEPCRC